MIWMWRRSEGKGGDYVRHSDKCVSYVLCVFSALTEGMHIIISL